MLDRPKRYAEAVDRAVGLPRWAWAPVVLGALDLLGAAWGYYWDVSWHIEEGRDESIFTMPHLLILLGLAGVAATGWTAHRMFVGAGAPGGIRIGPWTTAPGAALLVACGGFAILGFPLDDLWHRFFGEDVTAWGPIHLLMISGAALSPSPAPCRALPFPGAWTRLGRAPAWHIPDCRRREGGSQHPGCSGIRIAIASTVIPRRLPGSRAPQKGRLGSQSHEHQKRRSTLAWMREAILRNLRSGNVTTNRLRM